MHCFKQKNSNDNANDYVGSKEPNYFMGPTLYDTDVVNKVGMKKSRRRSPGLGSSRSLLAPRRPRGSPRTE